MQGTETIKTATLLTVDGTFKKFTFPVERRFDLSENGETQKKLGHFIHNGRDCGNSHYEFFPQLNTMVSLEDFDAKIQNLTLRKSFRVDGTFLTLGQSESRFCLVKNYSANHISEVDKITGRSVKLTKAAADFVGDTWHVNLFISGNGGRITRTEIAGNGITVSAWDVQKDLTLVEPHTVSYATELRQPRVLLSEADDDFILLVVSDGSDFMAKGRKIMIKTFTPGSFAVRQNILVELNGFNFQAVKDGPNTVGILFNDSENAFRVRYRWGIRRYDLTTGECVSSATIEVPAGGEGSNASRRN